MNSRERILSAIAHREPDRLPITFDAEPRHAGGGAPGSAEELSRAWQGRRVHCRSWPHLYPTRLPVAKYSGDVRNRQSRVSVYVVDRMVGKGGSRRGLLILEA